MENFKISIVMPVYNVKKYIRNSIESVIHQNCNNYELILIDDGSTDGSDEICDYYASRYNQIRCYHKKNGGLDSARNVGISKVKGDYLTFIDSDDYVEPGYLSYLNGLITNKKDVDLFVFGWAVVDEETGIKRDLKLRVKGHISADDYIKHVLGFKFWGGGGFTWNKVWKIGNKRIIPFDESQWCFEDKLWNIEMLNDSTNVFVDNKVFYNYIVRSDSLSHNKCKELDRKVNAIETYNKIRNIAFAYKYNADLANRAYWTLIVLYMYDAIKNNENTFIENYRKVPIKCKFYGNCLSRNKTLMKYLYIRLVHHIEFR